MIGNAVAGADILLINPPYHKRAGSGKIAPIGLAYVGAACRAEGMSVIIIDCALENESQTALALSRFRHWLIDRLRGVAVPKCIGVGPTTTPALKSLRVIAEVLKMCYPSIPVVYGGPFASTPGQEPIFFDLLGASALVRGDGEHVFPDLVRMLEKGDIGKARSGVVWDAISPTTAEYTGDLDGLRFPARDLLNNDRYRPSLRRDIFKGGPITAIYSSRGCPYECLFCVSPLLRNHKIARRSNANIFEEMRECIDSYNIRGFIFYDDCMFVKSGDIDSIVNEFAQGLMGKIGTVAWEMDLRCDAIAAMAPSSLRALYSSGCRAINMGIEKGSDKALSALRKRTTISQVVTACSKVNDVAPEMRLAGTFILGGPDETIDDVNDTIALARNLPLDFAHFYPFELYPGTLLFNDRHGGQSTAWAYSILADETNVWGELLYEDDVLSASRLLGLVQSAYKEFYDRPQWRERYLTRIAPVLSYNGLEIVDKWCNDRFSVRGEAN